MSGRKRKFKLNRGADIPEQLVTPEVEAYEEDHEPNPLLKKAIKYIIMALALVAMWMWYQKRDTIATIKEQAAEREEKELVAFRQQIEMGRDFNEFEEVEAKALKALEEENYFEAVFHFRNALVFDGHNIQLREKLLGALEKSCDLGNEMHCSSVDKERNRIQLLEKEAASTAPAEQ